MSDPKGVLRLLVCIRAKLLPSMIAKISKRESWKAKETIDSGNPKRYHRGSNRGSEECRDCGVTVRKSTPRTTIVWV